jgi:hypothetical protein
MHGLFMSDILMLSLLVLRRTSLLRRAATQASKLCSFDTSAATVFIQAQDFKSAVEMIDLANTWPYVWGALNVS